MKKEDNKPNIMAKQLITDNFIQYLKTRIELSNQLFDSEIGTKITLNNYKKVYDKLDDGLEKDYYKEQVNNIRLTPHEINELCHLISKAITTSSFNESIKQTSIITFIESLLVEYQNNICFNNKINNEEMKNELELIKKYLYTVGYNYGFGVDSRLAGYLIWKNNDFAIIDSNKNIVSKIGFDGTDKMKSKHIRRKEEQVLISNNLYHGPVYKKDGNCIYTLLYKTQENGKEVYQAINYDNKKYPLNENHNGNEYCIPFVLINDFLTIREVPFAIKTLYNKKQLSNAIKVLSKYKKINEIDKEEIDETSKYAAKFIVELLKKPLSNDDNLYFVQKNKFDKFKTLLIDEIKTNLVVNKNSIIIKCDSEMINNLLNQVQLKEDMVSIPTNTSLILYPGHIRIKDKKDELAHSVYSTYSWDNINPKRELDKIKIKKLREY